MNDLATKIDQTSPEVVDVQTIEAPDATLAPIFEAAQKLVAEGTAQDTQFSDDPAGN